MLLLDLVGVEQTLGGFQPALSLYWVFYEARLRVLPVGKRFPLILRNDQQVLRTFSLWFDNLYSSVVH
jgi:hypothetical protein